MKKLLFAMVFAAVLPIAAEAGTTKEDILKLAKAGLSEDVILSFVRTNGPVDKLSSDDLIELKAAGVTDKVLKSLLAPAPEAVEKVEEPGEPLQELNGAKNPYVRKPRAVEKEVVVERTVVETIPWPVLYSPRCTRAPYGSNYCSRHLRYDFCHDSTYYRSTSYGYSPSYYSGSSRYRTTTVCSPLGIYSYPYGRPRSTYYLGYYSYRPRCSSGLNLGIGFRW